MARVAKKFKVAKIPDVKFKPGAGGTGREGQGPDNTTMIGKKRNRKGPDNTTMRKPGKPAGKRGKIFKKIKAPNFKPGAGGTGRKGPDNTTMRKPGKPAGKRGKKLRIKRAR